MTFYIFSQKKLDEVKRDYMDLERRFNRLAGHFDYDDVVDGMSCLDYAEILIGRMSYGSGNLSKNMEECIEALSDLKRMVLVYERNLEEKYPESVRTGHIRGFRRVMKSADTGNSITMFAEYVEWIKDECKKGKSPEKILTSILGLDPEEVRLFIDAIEEDDIIKVKSSEQPKKKRASGMEAPATF